MSPPHADTGRCRTLLALATASNIGSASTVTGNPQNILIASVSGISFLDLLASIGPIAAVGLAVDAALIWLMFRRELGASTPPRRRFAPSGCIAHC